MPSTVDADAHPVYVKRSCAAAEQRNTLNAALNQVQPTVHGSLVSTGDWSTA